MVKHTQTIRREALKGLIIIHTIPVKNRVRAQLSNFRLNICFMIFFWFIISKKSFKLEEGH